MPDDDDDASFFSGKKNKKIISFMQLHNAATHNVFVILTFQYFIT